MATSFVLAGQLVTMLSGAASGTLPPPLAVAGLHKSHTRSHPQHVWAGASAHAVPRAPSTCRFFPTKNHDIPAALAPFTTPTHDGLIAMVSARAAV